jgi:hypothetical protein
MATFIQMLTASELKRARATRGDRSAKIRKKYNGGEGWRDELTRER